MQQLRNITLARRNYGSHCYSGRKVDQSAQWVNVTVKSSPAFGIRKKDHRFAKAQRHRCLNGGDFNDKVDRVLESGDITEKEATFCLLDQRTFECQWNTVEKLAAFKTSGNKIELFYFLANSWQERAFAAQKKLDVPAAWWGKPNWKEIRDMNRDDRRDAFVDRFKRDLGYKSAKAWPIFARENGGMLNYYMIHATDHTEAPKLMSRAYRATVSPCEPCEQTKLFPEHKNPIAQDLPISASPRTQSENVS
jgi:hypothetical protein